MAKKPATKKPAPAAPAHDFRIGDRVMQLEGPDGNSRGEVIGLRGADIHVQMARGVVVFRAAQLRFLSRPVARS